MTTKVRESSWLPIVGMWCIAAVAAYIVVRIEGWRDVQNIARVFAGVFLLTFSIPKLMHIRGFAHRFMRYDIVARHFAPYAYMYPFIELVLGFAYLFAAVPLITNAVALFIMVISGLSVFFALFEGRMLYSANMGAIFRVPLGLITLMENAVVASVALYLLWWM